MVRQTSTTFKDHLREAHIFQQRIMVMVAFAFIILLLIIARLIFLQIINHDHYTTLSEDNRLNILPIPPTRGLIYDRNGVLLAQNLPSFTLELIPEHISDIDATLNTLRDLIALTDEEIARFHEQRKNKRRFEGVPLRFRLNDVEHAKIAVHQDQLPGVEVTAELTRDYPQGKLASHAIGYVGRINELELTQLEATRYSATKHVGKTGVERSYEDLLHGEVGFERVETNSQGRIMSKAPELYPVPGKDIYMTIDARVQEIAEKAFGDNNGALVAIDPNNGEVLAFVSMPTFDPNIFVNGVDTQTYNALSQSPERPLFNRALQGQYPPGSTIKPFIGLAGLEEKVISTEGGIRCPGYYTLKGDERRYRDWKKEGHGETSLNKAIVESCDVYFYDLAQTLKIDRIESFLAKFGFGSPTGIDIRGEEKGVLPGKEWKRRVFKQPWYPGETLITGIGQGFTLATPLQLAEMTATLSADGERYKPRIVHAIGEPGIEEITLTQPRYLGSIEKNNPDNWKFVREAMINVVHSLRGTARGISKDLQYKIGGKTGTAQVFGIKQDEEYDEDKVAKKLRDHALFVAFAPADEPKIAVAVIVENGGHGGSAAAPVVRKVMDAYLLGDQ
jgi:penicillin-binding protein 2